MTPNTSAFTIGAQVNGFSGGTMVPTGVTLDSNSYCYLSGLTVDGDVNQVSAVTGIVSATTTYTFSGITTAHTISSYFNIVSGSTVFTMTPDTNYYLNNLYVNSVSKLGDVSGDVSGVTTYTFVCPLSNTYVNCTFKPYGE